MENSAIAGKRELRNAPPFTPQGVEERCTSAMPRLSVYPYSGDYTVTIRTDGRFRGRDLKTLALVGVTLTLGACASTPEPVIGAASAQARSDLGQDGYNQLRPTTYNMRPSDVISITVFREPDFSLDSVRVGVEGNVSIPMLGSVPAAGMTAKQFEQNVTQRLATLGLKSPMVSVNITEYASHLVTVEGAVSTPGVYAFEPGARLSSALALAQGTKREAKSDQVAVFRETSDGIQIAKFDYVQIRQGTMLDPILQPNDRVVVGTDGMSVAYQDFLRAIPVLGIFSTFAQ